MDEIVGIRELRHNLRSYLERVKRGERIVITERNVPIARVEPLTGLSGIERLVAEGRVIPPRRPLVLAEPLDIDLGDPYAATKALEYGRGYRDD